MKRLDLPPVWGALAAALTLLWAEAVDLSPSPAWLRLTGWLVIAAGVGWAAWAVVTLLRHDTPVEPRRRPRRLVTSGPFAWARHPVYRGLVWAVAGLALAAGEATALVVALGYALLLLRRFAIPEEAALEAAFGESYRAWAARVRARL